MQEPRELFVDLRTTVPEARRFMDNYRELRTEYLTHLRDEGKLIMAGPFKESSGGLIIFKASSPEEARELSDNDPFILHGIQKAELKTWSVRLYQ
jgi:uncharacterized protein YciI